MLIRGSRGRPAEAEALTRLPLLRRGLDSTENADTVLRVGRLTIDVSRHTVSAGGEPVECTPDEFAILAAMAAQPDRVLTRAQLLRYTRGLERDSVERSIDVHVLNLRRKVEPNPKRPARLVTVYGIGYKLTAGPV